MVAFLKRRHSAKAQRRAEARAEHDRMIAASIDAYDRSQEVEQERRRQLAEHREREMREGLPALSMSDSGPVCARCGGRQFEAVRSVGGMVLAGLLAPRDV